MSRAAILIFALQIIVIGRTHAQTDRNAPRRPLVSTPADELRRAEEQLEYREKAFDPYHVALLPYIKRLAGIYESNGSWAKAEKLWLRAVQIADRSTTAADASLGAMQHLTQIYEVQGLSLKAEETYQRLVERTNRLYGATDPRLSATMERQAEFLIRYGDPQKAEALLRQALRILEAAYGTSDAAPASLLINLGWIAVARGELAEGERLYRRALSVLPQGVITYDPRVAQVLELIGDAQEAKGAYDEAENYFKKALAIQQRVRGNVHLDIVRLYYSMARVKKEKGQLQDAETLYEKAWELSARTTVPPLLIASILYERAILLSQRGQEDHATKFFYQALSIFEKDLRQYVMESRVLGRLRQQRTIEEGIYNLLFEHPNSRLLRKLALAVALLRKGRSADEGAHTASSILRTLGQSERLTDFARLQELRGRQASLVWEGASASKDQARKLAALVTEAADLERRLAIASEAPRAPALPEPSEIVNRVQAALPADSVLVEVITTGQRVSGAQRLPRHYLALVLFSSGEVEAADLGETAPIDLAATQLLEQLRSPLTNPQPTAQALYKLTMAPLVPMLRENKRLLLSLDGSLNVIPFVALHDGKGYLVDKYSFNYLTSGRDLLRRKVAASRPLMSIFAAPDYEQAVNEDAEPQNADAVVAARGLKEQLGRIRPLPGTRLEAERIQQMIPQAQLHLGPLANKRALLNTAAEVLHVATHGVFLNSGAAADATRALQPVSWTVAAAHPTSQLSHVDNPLVKSALLLAGAGATRADGGAGAMLTALDVTGMNLWGTRLVVLSACDTGRGSVEIGEGIYGLRRAFFIAGAETLVTSLWQIADRETTDLMEQFYKNLLHGERRVASMQRAAGWMKQRKPHPYYWAPFIVIGQDAVLPGMVHLTERAPVDNADILRTQALTLYRNGRDQEAEALLQKILQLRESSPTEAQADVAIALADLGAMQRATGKYAQAKQSYKRVVSIQSAVLGAQNRALVAPLTSLATLYQAEAQFKKASALYRTALSIQESTLGLNHLELVETLHQLADLARSMGNDGEAESLYRRALTIQEVALGPNYPELTTTLYRLSALYHVFGQDARAEELSKRAQLLSPPSAQQRETQAQLRSMAIHLRGDANLSRDGDPNEALALLQNGNEKRAKKLLAQALLAARADGGYAKLSTTLERAIPIAVFRYGLTHPAVASLRQTLAQTASEQKNYDQAETQLLLTLNLRQVSKHPQPMMVAQALRELAEHYHRTGQLIRSEHSLQRALFISETQLGPEHPELAILLDELATLKEAQDVPERAEPLLFRALEIRQHIFGNDHPQTTATAARINHLRQSLREQRAVRSN